jgi:serine/threonine protein phosphatase 1
VAGRTIAIGDIHGCSTALTYLIHFIEPNENDTIVVLGDFIDRGPNSCSVLIQLKTWSKKHGQLIPILGDHEEMFLEARKSKAAIRKWLTCGGTETLRSFGWKPGCKVRSLNDWVSPSHFDFLSQCRSYYETPTHIFMHAGYVPELPMDQQPELALRWKVTNRQTALPHFSGKTAIVGHTPQLSGDVLDLGFVVGIDTNCVRGGWLTALDTQSCQIWQVDREGRLRTEKREKAPIE